MGYYKKLLVEAQEGNKEAIREVEALRARSRGQVPVEEVVVDSEEEDLNLETTDSLKE